MDVTPTLKKYLNAKKDMLNVYYRNKIENINEKESQEERDVRCYNDGQLDLLLEIQKICVERGRF